MNLNSQQQYAMDQIRNGGNYLITGGAGTGKSTLLHALEELPNVAFVAPTASAAMLIHGTTIHRLFQLPPLPILDPENMYPIRDKKTIRTICAIRTLVIDEASMLRSDLLAAIDYRLREYPTYDTDCGKVFGGRQIILCGDFFQLPPVCSKEPIDGMGIPEYLEKTLGGVFAFSTLLWLQAGFQALVLTESMRQQETEFSGALNTIRTADADHLDEALNLINTRVTRNIPQDAIKLCPSRNLARSLNEKAYRSLKGEERIFRAKISGDFGNDLPAEKELHLKIGERVIITANLTEDVINGSSGVVKEFTEQGVNVLLDGPAPQILFPVPVNTYKRFAYKTVFDERENRDVLRAYEAGSFTQYPLTPGYAVTIHRSQGMTLSKVAPMLFFSFAPGLCYVALSRCRRLEDLYLPIPVKKELIEASPEVKDAELLLTYNTDRFASTLKDTVAELDDDERFRITAHPETAVEFVRLLGDRYKETQSDIPAEQAFEDRYYSERLFPHLILLKRDNVFDAPKVMDILKEYQSHQAGDDHECEN